LKEKPEKRLSTVSICGISKKTFTQSINKMKWKEEPRCQSCSIPKEKVSGQKGRERKKDTEEPG